MNRNDKDSILNEYHSSHHVGVCSPRFDLAEISKHSAFEDRASICLKRLNDTVDLKPGQRVLDLGSGFGHFVALCRDGGFEAYGTDIDGEKLTICNQIFGNELEVETAFRQNDSKIIPFDDEFFDLITMFFVMEHVEDILILLGEMFRVLKSPGQQSDGGVVYIICPNYLWPYEPHYALPLPTFSKRLSDLCLKLAKRDQAFLRHINLCVRPGYLEPLFRRAGFSVKPIGLELWHRTLDGEGLECRSLELQRMVHLIRVLGMRPIFKFLAQRGLYTPLIYLLRKS